MDWLGIYDEFNIYGEENLNETLRDFVIDQFKKGCNNEQEMLEKLCEKFFYIDKEDIIKRLDESI